MISQKCPVCHSSRIRRGYRPTPIWLRVIFRYNLLCDNCNWEFVGFALPGFISPRQTKSSRARRERGRNTTSGTSRAKTDKTEVVLNSDSADQPKKNKIKV